MGTVVRSNPQGKFKGWLGNLGRATHQEFSFKMRPDLPDSNAAFEGAIRVEFWSHVESRGFLKRIIEHLRASGIDASHRFIVSEHDYRTSIGMLSRLWLRLRMFVFFPLKLTLRMIFVRGDAILVVMSNPFYAPLIARLLGGRHISVVHLLYDLYPDVIVEKCHLSKNSATCRVLDVIQRTMLRRCDATVLLGEHLLAHVCERFGEPHNPMIIPVGADDNAFDAPLTAKSGESERVRLLYCGNMGYMHDTDTLSAAILQVCSKTETPGLDFSFHASGTTYAHFCADVCKGGQPPACVTLDGYLNSTKWGQVMRAADVAIVTMKNGSERVMMPAKTYSAMQAAQAILAVVAPESDLAALVQRHECGWVIAPGDINGLVALLQSLPGRRDELRRKQTNAIKAANDYYSASVIAKQWESLFRSDLLRDR